MEWEKKAIHCIQDGGGAGLKLTALAIYFRLSCHIHENYEHLCHMHENDECLCHIYEHYEHLCHMHEHYEYICHDA